MRHRPLTAEHLLDAKPETNTMPVAEGLSVLRGVLARARPRPSMDDSQNEKNKYAIRFADHIAQHIADGLRERLKGIEASTKRTAGSVKGPTQLDVNFSTTEVGLAIGISLKSIHLRDKGSGARYTHNMKRNEEELRIEASGYHKRQPYAVMVAVLFLPFNSCDDAKTKTGASSLGSWVRHLRPYAGRTAPDDDIVDAHLAGLFASD
jgi:hypothetical protein